MPVMDAISRYGQAVYHLLGNRRKFERQTLAGPINVTYLDKYEQLVTYQCSCVNISPRGLAIESPVWITPNADVYVYSETLNLKTFACVRQCRPQEASYIIGMRFTLEPDYWPGSEQR